MKERETD